MQIFLTTFTAVAMLLTIGIIGYWMLSRKEIAGGVLGSLSALAIDISLPCLTFAGILTNFHPEKNTTWWTLPLWWLGSTALFIVLTFICSTVARAEYRREFRVSLLFQNGIFFPQDALTLTLSRRERGPLSAVRRYAGGGSCN
jgi:predicted permease